MKIHQYRPTFFEGFENEIKEFNTKEELLAIKWVKSWKDDPGDAGEFSGYMLSNNHLVATYNYNSKRQPRWFVIASFDECDLQTVRDWFPAWGEPAYIMTNGDLCEVVSKCGADYEVRINWSSTKCHVTEEWFETNYAENRFPVPYHKAFSINQMLEYMREHLDPDIEEKDIQTTPIFVQIGDESNIYPFQITFGHTMQAKPTWILKIPQNVLDKRR